MPSRSTLIACLALFAALAGTATAARLIDGKDIRKGTVTARQVKDRSLTTRDLSKSAVRSLRGRLAPVTGAQIADGTVGLADLAPGSVGSTQVVDRSLMAGDLVADTLTQTELGVGSVGDSELADNSVGNGEIKGNAISRNQLRPSVLRVGRFNAAFTAVATGTCQAQEIPGSTYQIPSDAFDRAVVEVEPPAGLPTGVIFEADSPGGGNLRLQLCNFSGSPVTVPASEFRFVAFGS